MDGGTVDGGAVDGGAVVGAIVIGANYENQSKKDIQNAIRVSINFLLVNSVAAKVALSH